MNRLSNPVLAFALLVAVVFLGVSTSGYGALFRYGWLIWLATVLLVVGLLSVRDGGSSQFVLNVVVVVAIGFGGMTVGNWTRRASCYSKCRSCQPVLDRLSAYRASQGAFPTNLQSFVFPQGITIQQCRLSGDGLDLIGLNQTDATLYLGTNGFLFVVPVTKILPISFTRFYAYVRSDRDRDWKYDHFVWRLGAIE
jgi:hypothetical protein